jgi:hypothetical protein
MAGPSDILGDIAPSIQSFGLGAVDIIAYIIVSIIVLALVTTGIIMFILNKKYNKIITIFEKVGGEFVPIGKDRGMEVRYSNAGDTITYLRKRKRYIPNPQIQTGKRQYWFYVRSDDELINFGLSDLNKEGEKAGAFFLDKEMRYSRTQIQKGLKDRYESPSIWAKYGIYIISFSYVALIGVMVWLLFDKWVDLAQATAGAVDTAAVVLDRIDQILGSMDNICTGGSGIVAQ